MKGGLFVLALGLSASGCGESAGERAAAAPASRAPAAQAARLAPPLEAFVAPRAWRSTQPGTPAVAPPALPTFRALVSQNLPLQNKTPRWQLLPPAQDTVELEMPEGSGFRCAVTPLRVTPQADDFGAKLHGWLLERSLLCSSDDFHHWTEQPYRVRTGADGTREPGTDSGALLRERGEGASVRQTYVLLRSDPEQRAATTGPPRIIPGAAVDTD